MFADHDLTKLTCMRNLVCIAVSLTASHHADIQCKKKSLPVHGQNQGLCTAMVG